MSFYVKCHLCIECKWFEPEKGCLVGHCQRSGQYKRGFDIGRCIGQARRTPEEVKKIVREYLRKATTPLGRITAYHSPDIDEYIPLDDDGFVGYHVMEEKRHSRSRSSQRPTQTQGDE